MKTFRNLYPQILQKRFGRFPDRAGLGAVGHWGAGAVGHRPEQGERTGAVGHRPEQGLLYELWTASRRSTVSKSYQMVHALPSCAKWHILHNELYGEI